MRRRVVAVPSDGAGGPADPRAVHQRLERRHLDGGVDGGDHLLGVGDVRLHEQATNLLGQRHTLVLLDVGHHDAHTPLGQQA